MHESRGSLRGAAFTALAIITFAIVLLASGPARGFAEGTYLGVPGLNDLCYDDTSGLLYVVSGSALGRLDVAAKVSRPDLLLSKGTGGLVGVDVSPDGKTIGVTDLFNTVYGVDQGTDHVWFVDAHSGAEHYVNLPPSSGQVGSWAVAFGADGKAIVSSAYPLGGACALYRVDPVTGVVTVPTVTSGFTDVRASGDRSVMAFAEEYMAGGPWGKLKVADGSVQKFSQPGGVYAAAVNRDGTQCAILAGTSAYIYDSNGTVRTVSGVLGAQYSPTADVLYMTEAYGSHIKAYDTKTLNVIASYDFEQTFTTYLGGVRGWPRLAVSRDNSLLFALTQNGFRYTRLRPAVTGSVHSSFRGAPLAGATVEIWRQNSGTWSREATTSTNEWGSWQVATDDTSTPLRVRVIDPSGINASQWIGGTDAASATNFGPSRLAPPSADVTLTVVAPAQISGTVRSTFRGRAVAGARVSLYSESERMGVIATTTTDANGAYQFPGLGVGRYHLGFVDPTGANSPAFYSGKTTLADSDPVVISQPGAISADQALSFIGYRVTGTVTSSFRGVPVSGARVEVWRQSDWGWSIDETLTASASGAWTYTTDTSATVSFRAVDPSGAADPVWYGGPDLDGATRVTPVTNATAPNVSIVMPLVHPGAIAGVVRSSSHGQPLADIRVELHQDVAGYPTLATTTTAADGSYSFGSLGVTAYRVGFTDVTGVHDPAFFSGRTTLASANVVAVSGPTTSSADATLTFVPTYVGGTLVSSWMLRPIANARVELWRDTGSGWHLAQTVQTDSSGAWGASFETSDPVRVYFDDPSGAHRSGWYGGGDIDSATDVQPTRRAAEEFTASLVLTHGAEIVGTVRSSWQGQPLPGVVATLYYDDGTGLRSVASTRTAANGSYIFDGVGEATVYVALTDPSGAHEANNYRAMPLVATVDGLLVNDVTLQRIPSAIGGTVYSTFEAADASGPSTIASAVVEVYRKGASGWALETTVTAAADGTWSYQAMDPSAVRVHVSDPLGMHSPAWVGGASLSTATSVKPTPVSLDLAPTDITLELTNPASFHGTLRDSVNGARLKGFGVALVQATPELPLVDWVDAADDGTYSIDGIPAGTYYLAFVDEQDSHYDVQFWQGASTPESATPIVVSGPGDHQIDPLIAPLVMHATFDPIEITNSTADPLTGSVVDLQTYLSDEYGDPVTDARVAVQTSRDRVNWTTDYNVKVQATPDDSLEATVVATAPGICTYYRFTVAADEFHAAAVSQPIYLNPHAASYLADTTEEGPDGWTPLVGMSTGISATAYTGSALAPSGRSVRLLSSADGVTFVDSGIRATDRGFGQYEADFSVASRVWCKLVWDGPDGPVYSATAMIQPRASSGAYFEKPGFGAPSVASWSGKQGSGGSVIACLRTHASSAARGMAYVESSADGGLTWALAYTGVWNFVAPNLPSAASPSWVSSWFGGSSVNTRLRYAWVANDWSDAAASTPIDYRVWLPVPQLSVPSRARAYHSFKVPVTAYAGAGTVVVQRRSGGRWVAYRSYNFSHSFTGSAYRTSVTLRLKAGTYRVMAYNRADAAHIQSPNSAARSLTVK